MSWKRYAKPFSHYWITTLGILFIAVAISAIYLHKLFEADESVPDRLWDFVEPVVGIVTLFTTIGIFYFQAYKRWEDGLEKRLTIFYILPDGNQELVLAQIENSYLGNKDDIRSWAQSLGAQIFGNLSFDMYWGEIQTQTIQDAKTWYKDYQVKIFLTENPLDNAEIVENKVKPFLQKRFLHSEVIGNLDSLPIVWKRKSFKSV